MLKWKTRLILIMVAAALAAEAAGGATHGWLQTFTHGW